MGRRSEVSRGSEAIAALVAFDPAALDDGREVTLDASTCTIEVVCEGPGTCSPRSEPREEVEPARGVSEEPGGILHVRNNPVGREKI